MRPPVAILCGGRGTRLRERTASMPKALVEIGGEPILGHVIEIYASRGFDRFILATGYRGAMVEEFVRHSPLSRRVAIQCVDTGPDTPTGGRVHRLGDRLGDGTFCLTYADGVADIDLDTLLGLHASRAREATVTVVRPTLPWGIAELDEDDDSVRGFREKPRGTSWVNGGFFCFEPAVLDRLAPDSVLEHDPLEELAAAGQLTAYRHTGFWDCMDTYKDSVVLNDLWEAGQAPWAAKVPSTATE